MPLTIRFTARSHVGRIREGNEDSAYAGPRLLVVADGMGGHAAGEIASAAAVETIRVLDDASGNDPNEASGTTVPPPTAVGASGPRFALRNAVLRANDQLRVLAERNSARRGMGTTVTAMLWDGERFAVAHVGDSRAYLLREGVLRQITRDHTFVQTLVDEGRISLDEAEHHPQRSIILRALDGRGQVELDLFDLDVEPLDRVLVCSDGLSGVLSADAIGSALGTGDLNHAADRLISLALDGGAPDNVTCVVAEVIDTDAPPTNVRAEDDTASIPLGRAVGAGLVVGAAAELDLASLPGPPASSTETPDRRMPSSHGADGADDEEVLRYAPREPARYRWVRRLGVLAIVVALLGGLAYAGWTWTRTQYYVGVENNQVAIFRGLDQHFVGQSLSTVYEVSDIRIDDLPMFEREQVQTSISASSLDDARTITAHLATRAEACVRLREQATSPDDTQPTSPPASSPPTSTGIPSGTTSLQQSGTSPPTSAPGGTAGPATATPPASESASPTSPGSSTPTRGPEDEPVTRAECGITE